MLDHASRALCSVLALAKAYECKGEKRIEVLIDCEDRDEDIIIDIDDTSNPFKSCAVRFDYEEHDWYVLEMRDGQIISYECEYLDDESAWPKYLEAHVVEVLMDK